ncbi:hypothetical protein VSU19_10895 [Verrucomicrobiales bacterium BCK34]|nr:hypothetical protein [Verrucomicrobiales bacterium BCK34]
MKRNSPFHDFHGLGRVKFDRPRCIVLCGVSGAGKSTAIRCLQEWHSDCDFEVVDEVRLLGDLRAAVNNASADSPILIASHLPPLVHRLIRPWRVPQQIFEMDRNRGQIEAWLTERGIGFSPEAVSRFLKTYRASYVDLEIIVDAFPSDCFDESLHQFEKQRTVIRTPEPEPGA